jgi:6-phosphofructokinase 1
VRTTVLGHVQRGGDPTPFDRVLATQFGHHAAQLVLQGQFGHMVTLQNGRIGSVAIADVANTQRTVPLDRPAAMARDIGICLGEAAERPPGAPPRRADAGYVRSGRAAKTR